MVSMNNIPIYNFANDTVKYKYLEKLDISPDFPDKNTQDAAKKYILRRNRHHREATTLDKYQAAVGSILGTVAAMAFIMKRQKIKNPLKIKYGIKDMVLMSGAPIVAGVGVGMIGNDTQSNLGKTREGVFQFLNASVPALLTGGILKLCESNRKLNNIPTKIISILAGIIVGVFGAAELSNKICDPKDKYPDRKVTLRDSLANLDDLIAVFVLAKFKFVEYLHLEKLLPLIFTYCGYRAGKSN